MAKRIDFSKQVIPTDVLRSIPIAVAYMYEVIPIRFQKPEDKKSPIEMAVNGGTEFYELLDEENGKLKEMEFAVKRKVIPPYWASRENILDALEKYYPKK